MKSMTGYGYAEYSCDNYLLTMELKSYNNRFFEVSYFAPSVLAPYENEITDLIKKVAARGHVDLSVKLKTFKGNLDVTVDDNAVLAYINAVKKISEICKDNHVGFDSVKVSDFLRMEGVTTSSSVTDLESYRDGLNYCSSEVLKQFAESKDREGLATCRNLEELIDSFDNSLGIIKTKADFLEEMLKNNLISKMKELLEEKDIDENRILSEVAVLLMKYTINEEMVRLDTHIAEFRKLLAASEPTGKKMDFLCQEMNREVNTIGSKSQMVEINLQVVNMKDCLENIREQIRNIE